MNINNPTKTKNTFVIAQKEPQYYYCPLVRLLGKLKIFKELASATWYPHLVQNQHSKMIMVCQLKCHTGT